MLDFIEVRVLGPVEVIGLEKLANNAPTGHLLDHAVRIEADLLDCLLLPAQTCVSFDLVLPESHPRFDASTGIKGGNSVEEAMFQLLIDDVPIAERRIKVPEGRRDCNFEPWVISLQAFAGKHVKLSVRSSGHEQCLPVLGCPRVLGNDLGRKSPNLLVISIDTLRADHLGSYGHELPISPNIDALAREGTLFQNAYSPVSYTLPAHATILTGQHPLVHGVHDSRQRIDPERSLSLASRLRSRGYFTAAFTGGVLVDPAFGFAEGFDQYSTREPSGIIDMLQKEKARIDEDGHRFSGLSPAMNWIERHGDQAFFLFVHTYFVHNYLPHDEFAARFPADLPSEIQQLSGADIWSLDVARDHRLDPLLVRRLHQLYCGTVAEVDELLVRPLLATLDDLGIADETIVVLLSDHGEEFTEHGHVFHGRSLWSELVRVPWIMRGPGLPRGARLDKQAGLVDFVPTISPLFELAPDCRWTGINLLQASSGTRNEPGIVLHLRSMDGYGAYCWDGLIDLPWKLLREVTEDGNVRGVHLFRLDEDPYDRGDLHTTHADRVARMQVELEELQRSLIESAGALPSRGEREAEIDGALLERMRALGYVDR